MLNRALLKNLMALIVSMTLSAPIAAENYVEGVHYEAIDIPVKTGLEGEQPPKVEVVEVFSYMCIHCYSFDPLLKLWEQNKAEQAVFNRLPAVFSADWELMARAFYTAEILDVSEQMHEPLFGPFTSSRRTFVTKILWRLCFWNMPKYPLRNSPNRLTLSLCEAELCRPERRDERMVLLECRS